MDEVGSNFKDPSTGEWITGFQAMEDGLNANMYSMQKGEFVVIMLSIIDKSQDKSPPDVNPPSDDFDVDCNLQTAEKIKVNNKDTMKLQAECTGNTLRHVVVSIPKLGTGVGIPLFIDNQ